MEEQLRCLSVVAQLDSWYVERYPGGLSSLSDTRNTIELMRMS